MATVNRAEQRRGIDRHCLTCPLLSLISRAFTAQPSRQSWSLTMQLCASLDLFIGLAFKYFLLSLIAGYVQEIIAGFLN